MECVKQQYAYYRQSVRTVVIIIIIIIVVVVVVVDHFVTQK